MGLNHHFPKPLILFQLFITQWQKLPKKEEFT